MAQKQKSKPGSVTADIRYVASSRCEMCGEPTRTLSVKCLKCLERIHVKEELKYVGDLLRANRLMHTPKEIDLAHDKKKVRHLALFRTPSIGWCGVTLSQQRKSRQRVIEGEFPEGICGSCLELYQQICQRG